jgi:general secretion pathway protein A
MNIEEYWGLKEKPFLNTPDTKYLFESENFMEAQGRILYNLEEVKGGITMIVGEIGCGKTLLVHNLLEKLEPERYDTVSLINPRLSPSQLLNSVASGFGMAEVPRYRNKILAALHKLLLEKNENNITPVLLIDEAQAISSKLLEEIRLLLNFEDAKKKLLQIVLFGQPELKKRIKELEQLNQRINVRYHLRGLNVEETRDYVLHRLKIAQARKPIFSRDAVPMIFQCSRGIPRLINTIATNALYAGSMMKKETIDGELVEEVHREMGS